VEWTVRRATREDVSELARVNVAAWRRAYRGIVPDEFLDGMDSARRELGWARWVALPEPDAVFVATNGASDRVVAYAGVCAVRNKEDAHPSLPTGELVAIYADPAMWRCGAGHAVHEAAVSALARFGFRHAVLWVFEDNMLAQAFYRRHGWTSDGVRQEFEVGGQRPFDVRYSRPL
jgi:ribosomal protein S18 acetylase RimI-like enzyme